MGAFAFISRKSDPHAGNERVVAKKVWKGGRVEGWKGGSVEGWKGGRVAARSFTLVKRRKPAGCSTASVR